MRATAKLALLAKLYPTLLYYTGVKAVCDEFLEQFAYFNL